MNMKKTPVSMLQEMMVKQGTSPSYELIFDGGGTHQNTFTYQVTCNRLTATGTGRCKKDAKHEAATAMLETIAKHNALPQLPATPCESPIKTPVNEQPPCPKSPANVPFRNAIGELQDLCSTNNLSDPEYQEISDVGPPHARIFTIHCLVSTFKEEGIATTKKQAKHEAARKMLNRIMNVVAHDLNAFKNSDDEKEEEASVKLAISKYPQLTHVENKSKVTWGLKIDNYHKKFKESFDDEKRETVLVELDRLLVLIQQCNDDCQNNSFLEVKKEFENFLKLIEMQGYQNTFKSVNAESKYISGLQINSAPDFYEIGIGKTTNEAEFDALKKMVKTMKFFLE